LPHPYLSLVIPTRNDTYPSNVLAVQNKCLTILQRQLESAGIDSEIIIVEYNPDPSRPHLHESLQVDAGRHVTIRVISVPPPYHRRFRRWETRVFHQTCAVNVGLQRSRGEFFVYRAADHVYSDALVRFLAGKALAPDRIYRCDRFDVEHSAIDALSPDDLAGISGACEKHIVDWHKTLEVRPSFHIPPLHTNASGDFLLMSRAAWMGIGGLHEGKYPVFLDYDSLALHAGHALGNREEILPADCRVYKLHHGLKSTSRLRQEWTPFWQFLDRVLISVGNETVTNWGRMLFNYPRRRDATLEGVVLDSFERHFLLPAQLWAHGYPFLRQNYGRWGLQGESLPEEILTLGSWDVHA